MSKLKFLPISNYYLENTLEIGKIVDNPSNYKTVPDGKYEIRGNFKDHVKKYHVFDNVWYLMEDRTKDNGHYMTNATTYQLFPNLSEKEWELMNKIPYKRLTKYWQRARFGYNFYMSLMETKRRAQRIRIKIMEGKIW